MAKEERRHIVGSISRVLELPQLLSVEEPGLSLTEMSTDSAFTLAPASGFRLLTTLQAYGYVEESHENRKYRLGLTCQELGGVSLKQSDIRQRVLPILKGLRDECEQMVHLGMLSGTRVVCLQKLDALCRLASWAPKSMGALLPIAARWAKRCWPTRRSARPAKYAPKPSLVAGLPTPSPTWKPLG